MRIARPFIVAAVVAGTLLLVATITVLNYSGSRALPASGEVHEEERAPPVPLGEALLGERPVVPGDLPTRWQNLAPHEVGAALSPLLDEAHSLFTRRQFGQAEDLFREARLGALYANDPEIALHALNFLIASAKWTNRYDQQWEVLQRAAAEAAAVNEPAVRAETAQIHAEYFSDLKLWRRAAGHYLEAVEGFRNANDHQRWLSAAVDTVEVMFNEAGLIDDGLALCADFTAHVLDNPHRDKEHVSELVTAAELQRYAQDYETAVRLLKQAQELAGELGERAWYANALRSLAHTWWGMGQVHRAISCYHGLAAIAANSPDVEYDHWNDSYLAKLWLAAGDGAAALDAQHRAWRSAIAADDWSSQFQRDLAEFAELARRPAYMRWVVCAEEAPSQTGWYSSPARRRPPHGVTPGMADLAIRCFVLTGETDKARDLLDFAREGDQLTGMWVISDITLMQAEALVLNAEGEYRRAAELQRQVVEAWRGYGMLHYETEELYLLAQLEARLGDTEQALMDSAEAFALDSALISELYYGAVLVRYGMQKYQQEWPAYADLLEAAGETQQAQQVRESLVTARRLYNELLTGFPHLRLGVRDLLTKYRSLQSQRRLILDEYFAYPQSAESRRQFLRTHYYAPPPFVELFESEHQVIQQEMRERADRLAMQAAATLDELAVLDPQLAALLRLEPLPGGPGR